MIRVDLFRVLTAYCMSIARPVLEIENFLLNSIFVGVGCEILQISKTFSYINQF
jgi:hypothetical protein